MLQNVASAKEDEDWIFYIKRDKPHQSAWFIS